MTEQGESALRIMRDISNTAEKLARRMGGEFVPYERQPATDSSKKDALPIYYPSEYRG